MEDNRTEKEKINKIKGIIEKEIEKELLAKQNEVSEISEKIKNVLRNLELLKYVVAVSYYDQNPVLSSKKGQDESNEDEKSQTQIHPCIKKLLPFKEAYEKSMGNGSVGSRSYETRKSKKTELEANLKSVNIKKEIDESKDEKPNVISNAKMPQYVPPLPNGDDAVSSVNSTGGDILKEKFRVVVGNVSKWIPPDTREDNSTHKWMVYIRNKEEGKDVTKHLKKIRYFLHESYKPHDIIDVTTPFQLTRRGWGEFPIRVQLHFVHPLNKPVDIIHNLKLDLTCSGIQTLGGETVVDISLYTGDSTGGSSKDSKKPEFLGLKKEFNEREGARERQDVFDGDLLMSINGEKTSEGNGRCDDSCAGIVKQEPVEDEPETSNCFLDRRFEEMNKAVSNSRKFLLDRRKAIKIIEIEHDYLGGKESSCDQSINDYAKSILKLDADGSEKPLKNGIVLNPDRIGQKGDRFLGTNLLANHQSEEEIFKRLKNAMKKDETESQSKYCLKVFRHAYLVNVLQRAQASNMKSVESLIRWFVQRWPVITKLSSDPAYKMIHPYSCPTETEFFRYSVGKQRSAEWFRAKAIQKVLKTLKSIIPIEEEIWTTKQILLWCRFHGYFPISSSSSLSSSGSTTTSTPSTSWASIVQNKSEAGRSHESSSDSEDGLDKAIASKMGAGQYLNGVEFNEKKKNFKKNRKKDGGEKEGGTGKPIDYRECNTYTEEQCDSTRFGYNDFKTLQEEEDCVIDVVGLDTVNESPTKKVRRIEMKVSTIPSDQMVFNRFVCETARQMGAKITEEEIVPGVMCDSVSRVLSQSVSCFLDDLVRRSYARAWMRNGERCPETLELNDILGTLIEHPQFDVFTNRGLGQQMPGVSNA